MGYSTKYKLDIAPLPPSMSDLVKLMAEKIDGGSLKLNDLINREIDEWKWYDHEDDMRRISKAHGDLLFTLRGEGETSGDLWVKYFKGGKLQAEKLEVKFPPFDESKLK